MLKNSFFKIILFIFFIVLFNSCDKEFNVVGEDIVSNPSFGIHKDEYPVVAYNEKIEPIQSNDMEVNPLGTYENPDFGKTKANFVTQVALETLSLDFHESAKVKSVVLTIPYFYDSSKTVLNADGSSTYVLDSIYGPSKAKMKLSVYESGYFMRDLDPEDQFTQAQKYYTNQYSEFYAVKKGVALNDNTSVTAENSQFFFNPEENVVENADKTKTRTPPGMKLNLNNAFFEQKILKASDAVLSDNNLFKEYFRGLVFDIENIGTTEGNMAMINFQKGIITVTYEETINSKVTEKTMVIKLTGHTSSFLEQSNTNPDYADAVKLAAEADKLNGVPNLYLKGGEGSMSVLKLFGEDKFGKDGVSGIPNGVPDKLDIMRYNNYLVNQAELTFYLNSRDMKGTYIPQRIYLYDFTNNKVLVDYYDATTVGNTKNNKFVFGGIFTKQTEEKGGSYYKFRITNHIRSLVKNIDSTNVDLGLVVTENINKPAFYSVRDKVNFPLKAPMSSVMNPLGVILFGNNVATDDKEKRLKFEIYYTKAN